MKLYLLRYTVGTETTSLRKPIDLTPEKGAEYEAFKASVVPGTNEMIDLLMRFGGMTQPQAAMYIEYLYYYAYCVANLTAQGYSWVGIRFWVSAKVEATIASYGTASATAALLWPVVILGVILAGLYIVNPKSFSDITLAWQTGTYVMAYNERLWWGHFLGFGDDGLPLYAAGLEFPSARFSDLRGVLYNDVYYDRWDFYNQWNDEFYEFPLYHYRIWSHAFVAWIGMLDRIAPTTFKLQSQYHDPLASLV